MTAPRVFWSEWERRTPAEKRSIERARLLAGELDLAGACRPVLTVVGSKGKGTAATYASAYLAAAGLRVVTVTSPALRGSRDRIRCQGHAVSVAELARLADRLDAARAKLPAYLPGGGYLSPSGLFILAGVLHARTVNADVVVLEAGMGGSSDEVSLFTPAVLGVTAIFGEHLDVLGATPAEVAKDKAGVVTGETRAVLSLPQDEPVAKALAETITARSDGRLSIEFVRAGVTGIPARLFPHGFGRANAELGCAAAQRLLDATVGVVPAGERLSRTLSSVTLPGRWSSHTVPGTEVRVFADSAINRAGVAAALTEVCRRWGGVDWVLACFPDHKDVAGAIIELGGLQVTYVRLTGMPRLSFTHETPPGWESVDAGEIDREFLLARGPRIVALGTTYFIAHMLRLLDADTERLFAAVG